jgi:hypothetical protein
MRADVDVPAEAITYAVPVAEGTITFDRVIIMVIEANVKIHRIAEDFRICR